MSSLAVAETYGSAYTSRRSLDRVMIGQYVTLFGDVVSHVNISNVKAEDGGEYECEAESRAGVAKHQARLNIYGECQANRWGGS